MRLPGTFFSVLALTLFTIVALPTATFANKDADKSKDAAKQLEQKQKEEAEYEITIAAFTKLLTDYADKPDPKLAITVLTKFNALPHSPINMRASSEAFVAGLIATNPDFITQLAPVYDELTDTTAMGLARAVLMSGRDDWTDRIAQLKKLWPGRAKIIDALAAGGARPVTGMDPLAQHGGLELLWSYYGSTASPKVVETIVSALSGLEEKKIASRLMAAYAAKYTIAAKASDSPKFADLCKPFLKGPHGAALSDALLAAETNNFDRLKTEASAAILAVAPPPTPKPEKTLRTNQR